MVVPADQTVFVSPGELPSEEQVVHSCMCETSHLKVCDHQNDGDGMNPSNRKAGVGEDDNVSHPPLPLLHQHRKRVCNILQGDHTPPACILGLGRRCQLFRLLKEEEDKEETEGKDDGASPETAVVAKAGYFGVNFEAFRKMLTV